MRRESGGHQPNPQKPKRPLGGKPLPRRRSERFENGEGVSAKELEGGGADFTSLEMEFEGSYRPEKTGRSTLPDIAPQPRLARPPRKPRPTMDTDAATDIIRGLNASVTTIRGIGPKMA